MEKKEEDIKKAEKVKRRTSLKNIIGGDILATDFFRRQTKLMVLIMILILFLSFAAGTRSGCECRIE